jgi:hypothetical protein
MSSIKARSWPAAELPADLRAEGLQIRRHGGAVALRVEHRVDALEQLATCRLDLLQVRDERRLARVFGFFQQDRAVAEDGVDGRPQLVPDVRAVSALLPGERIVAHASSYVAFCRSASIFSTRRGSSIGFVS